MKKRKGKLRLGIIWANPYCSNLGVEALAYSTLILFEEVSKRTGLKFEYIMVKTIRKIENTLKQKLKGVK